MEDKGFIEKERKFRNRKKKRRPTPEEVVEAHEGHPRHIPYKRQQKDWYNLLLEDDE